MRFLLSGIALGLWVACVLTFFYNRPDTLMGLACFGIFNVVLIEMLWPKVYIVNSKGESNGN